MSAPDIRSIRNVALVAQGGGGKTTLAEAILFNAKAIAKRGTVERGDTVLTTEPEEVERGITITPHTAYCTWQGTAINLVDTPGFINFLESTRGVLSVVGGALMVVNGDSGVKSETERIWRMIQEAELPSLCFINKMDMPRADFIRTMGELEKVLGVVTLPVSIPIGSGEAFQGIVDLIARTAWSAKNGVFEQIPLPASIQGDLNHYRTQLIEKIVETNDDMLEKYLEDGTEPEEEALLDGMKELVLSRRILPVFCGAGLLNIGVRTLANAIVRYLPSPLDKDKIKPLVGVTHPGGPEEVRREPSPDAPFSALVFKTVIDPFAGRLSTLRVFSGTLRADAPIYNATRQVKEKPGHLFRLQGKEMTPVDALYAGEIGAVAKLAETQSGDTLCTEEAPIHYARVTYREPGVAFAVEAEGKTEEKVAMGLARLAEEDPTLRFFRDEHTREMILAGMGQTHLQVTLERLKRKFGAQAQLKAPKVPYKETIRGRSRVQGRLKKQTGGHGQFGDCWLEMEPRSRGSGFLFEDRIVGGVIPRQFIPSVEKGVVEAMVKGIIGGFEVVDVKVALVDGSHHTVDSSDFAFKVAGSMAFKKGMEEADPVLLEPVMSMEIVVPDESLGDVIGDLNSRRGRITGVVPVGGNQKVEAEVPMAEVLDYGNLLNGLTGGRGYYTMNVATYEEVPSHIARKVLEGQKEA